MAARRRREEVEETRRKPATTPEARENELVSLAMDEAERQMREGAASSQVITHFLKAGSIREKLEHERLVNENELTKSKIEQIESQKRMEELYGEAIKAMRDYAGDLPTPDEDVED